MVSCQSHLFTRSLPHNFASAMYTVIYLEPSNKNKNYQNIHTKKGPVKQLAILKVKFEGFSHNFTKLGI